MTARPRAWLLAVTFALALLTGAGASLGAPSPGLSFSSRGREITLVRSARWATSRPAPGRPPRLVERAGSVAAETSPAVEAPDGRPLGITGDVVVVLARG